MPYTIDVTEDGHLAWPPHRVEYPHQRLMKTTEPHWRKTLVVLAKGPVIDKSGLATAKLAKKIKWPHGQPAMSMMLATMEDTGLVSREINGKRTMSIAIAVDVEALPPEWFPSSNGHHAPDGTDQATETDGTPATVASNAPEAEATTDAPERMPDAPRGLVAVPEIDPLEWHTAQTANDGVDYSLLAAALLERVVELATGAATADPDSYDRGVVLSVQLTHANNQAEKLRKRITVLEKELAVSAGLVKSYRVQFSEEQRQHRGTEANLRSVLQTVRKLDANQILDEDKRTALAKMLREIPLSPDTQRAAD
jgi:hypothetical protein